MTTEIPSVLPDIEETDLRESLLQKGNEATAAGSYEIEDEELEEELPEHQPKRFGKWIRTAGAFLAFLSLLVLGLAWFFGIGWFSRTKPEVVHRNVQNTPKTGHESEDERLKIALNMVAAKEPQSTNPDADQLIPGTDQISTDTLPDGSALAPRSEINSSTPTVQLPDSSTISSGSSSVGSMKGESNPKVTLKERKGQSENSKAKNNEGEPIGKSIFFGISGRAAPKSPEKAATENSSLKASQVDRPHPIPFGTLLPVRLIGSVYTLRNAGGYVRMELTRPVEGKGYKYPAGTLLVGNVRGDESIRAFVKVVGLIDPTSGEFLRLSGDLLGIDGASGVEGRRRNLTGKWTKLLRGLKDTASSVVGSIGSLRGGGTVILSDQVRRGSSSVADEVSGAVLNGSDQNTFIEVIAGTTGYVLVTELPQASVNPASLDRTVEGEK